MISSSRKRFPNSIAASRVIAFASPIPRNDLTRFLTERRDSSDRRLPDSRRMRCDKSTTGSAPQQNGNKFGRRKCAHAVGKSLFTRTVLFKDIGYSARVFVNAIVVGRFHTARLFSAADFHLFLFISAVSQQNFPKVSLQETNAVASQLHDTGDNRHQRYFQILR